MNTWFTEEVKPVPATRPSECEAGGSSQAPAWHLYHNHEDDNGEDGDEGEDDDDKWPESGHPAQFVLAPPRWEGSTPSYSRVNISQWEGK